MELKKQWRLDVTDAQVTEALKRWGKVYPTSFESGEIVHWAIIPFDEEAFTDATDFNLCEAKYNRFNVVRHELYRINRILP